MTDNMNNHEEIIVFNVGDQEFCVHITSTREIRGWTASTTLPHSPDYLMGVINLRGTILPIVDLAKRFGLSSKGPTERHVIIVVQVNNKSFGLLVDSVSDILDVGPDQIRPLPELDDSVPEEFFKQVVVVEDRIICEILPDNLLPEDVEIAA